MTARTETSTERLDVYVVEGEEGKAFWTKIGSAWPHKNGEGFNIQLLAYPVNGRLTVRKPKPKADAEPAAKQGAR